MEKYIFLSRNIFLESFYKWLLKPILFKIDPESVHIKSTALGEWLGERNIFTKIISSQFKVESSSLRQKLAGIEFSNPIGLAAGFDYEARLTQITPCIGFGFHSVGTITKDAFKGNPRPQLGRLPKSKSLMVNKGFRNLGAEKTAEKLKKLNFGIPLGISIGRTNSAKLNQKQSIRDIIHAFEIFEKAQINNSYYELNISCPNLFGNITFYTKNNLGDLLSEIDKLRLKKPVFIKMPISNSDLEIQIMLDVISKHSPTGVIFGNLQKDRSHPLIIKEEVNRFKIGNFSGRPTFERSNELISLAYRNYKNRFLIIGCGGIFCAEDAYKKIKLGASLVQLITGMIFEGPQIISFINHGLVKLLEKDGYSNISQAVGVDNN